MATPQIENGYTKIANELLGEMIKLHLSGNEWSILHCVMRKTWGWNKKEDRISFTQFEKETDLIRSSVGRAILVLTQRNILLVDKSKSVNIYRINKDYSQWIDSSKNATTARVVRKPLVSSSDNATNNDSSDNATGDSSKIDTKVVAKLLPTKETTKETIQKKHLPSEKDFNEIDIEAICNDYQVPESFVLSKWDDVLNYCLSNNKKYADFNRTLRNWVKKDSIKLKQEAHGKSTIGFVKTE